MKKQSIYSFIAVISLSIIFYLILNNNIIKYEEVKIVEDNGLNLVEQKLDSLINKKINLSDFTLIKAGKNQDIKKTRFKLLALFSIKGCNNCLFDELAEWEQIYNENHNFDVYAICADKNDSDVYRFISRYAPTIPVFRDKSGDYVFTKNATSVLIADENNIIEYVYYSEIGNVEKRQSFYSFLSKL